jgi:hypothetical protein
VRLTKAATGSGEHPQPARVPTARSSAAASPSTWPAWPFERFDAGQRRVIVPRAEATLERRLQVFSQDLLARKGHAPMSELTGAGAPTSPAADSDLVKLKTIARHLMDTWCAVLRQRQYIKALSEDTSLIGALDKTYAAHVHNAIGVALVIDASLPNLVRLLRKEEVLNGLCAEMTQVHPSRYVDAAAAESLRAAMTAHAQGYYASAGADLDWIERELLGAAIAPALTCVRNKAVAHNDLVHQGDDWKLWQIEGTGLTYGQLDEFIDTCTDAVNRVTHLALRRSHAYDNEPETARRWANEYAAALTLGLNSSKKAAT